ncbi:hypothetical protein AAVH_25644 [Aphelenchoides avenae]|nr:hypothetical protein AAVH_25644 [Aphelenchus avenae]
MSSPSPDNTQELPEPLPGGSNTSQKATTPSCFELRSPSGNAVFRMDWGGGGKKVSALKSPPNGANGHGPAFSKAENDTTTPLIIDDSIGESWLSVKANMKAAASGSPPVGKLKIRMKNFRGDKARAKIVKSPTKVVKGASSSTPSSSKSAFTPKHIAPPAKRGNSPRKTAQLPSTSPKKSRDSVAEKVAKARGAAGSTSGEKLKETRRKSKPEPATVLNGKMEDKIPSASKSAERKLGKHVDGPEPPGTSAAGGRIARMNSSSSSMNGRSPSPSKKPIGLVTPTGYQMTHLSSSAKKRYWACIYRRPGDDPLGCHGTASSDLNCGDVKEWREHNHPPGVAPDGSVTEGTVAAVNGATSDVAAENGGSMSQAQNRSPIGAPKPVSSRKPTPKAHAQTSSTTSTSNGRGTQPLEALEEDHDGSEWDDDYLPEIPMDTKAMTFWYK